MSAILVGNNLKDKLEARKEKKVTGSCDSGGHGGVAVEQMWGAGQAKGTAAQDLGGQEGDLQWPARLWNGVGEGDVEDFPPSVKLNVLQPPLSLP